LEFQGLRDSGEGGDPDTPDDPEEQCHDTMNFSSGEKAVPLPSSLKGLPIVIYTTKTCPHCHRAKALLKEHRMDYVEIDLTDKPEERAQLTARTHHRTVPQIFIGDQFIGGADELEKLLKEGVLPEGSSRSI
jgi:glutaredoxin 3